MSSQTKDGDTFNIKYEFMKDTDVEEVVDVIMKHFFPREPITIKIGLDVEDQKGLVADGIENLIEKVIGIVARDVDKNCIVGVKLLRLVKREGYEKIWSGENLTRKKSYYMGSYLAKVEDGYPIFEKHTDIDEAYEHILLAVDHKYGNRGIGQKLVQMSDDFGREKGLTFAKAVITNVVTKHLFGKLGYKEQFGIDYDTFEIDGVKPFDPSKMTDSKGTVVMIKYL